MKPTLLQRLQVAVALGTTVYLWNANTGDIEQLMECQDEDEYVTSVSWGADGKHIAVGTSSATVQIWDANRVKQIRNLNGHAARVGALSWNNAILSSGGRDSIIVNHDVRYRSDLSYTTGSCLQASSMSSELHSCSRSS